MLGTVISQGDFGGLFLWGKMAIYDSYLSTVLSTSCDTSFTRSIRDFCASREMFQYYYSII